MATLSDLKEVKEALDAGLVSQGEYDAVKSDYLRMKKDALEAKKEALEFQRKELRAKEEALEFQKRELIAKEEFQQRKSEADLRAYALELIVKHGSRIMSEEQKIDLVLDYAKMSGLDGGADKDKRRASKRQRVSAEKRDAAPPQPSKPPRTPPAPPAAVPPHADASAPVMANQATAPAPRRSKRVRSMSALADAPAPVVANQARAPRPRHSKRFRSMSALVKEKEAAAAASEDGNSSDDDSEDDSHSDEPRTGKRWKRWTEEDDAVLVAALRAGQKAYTIRIGGRAAGSSAMRLSSAKANGSCTPVLREYLEETCPDYVYKPPSERLTLLPWSAEEDQTFIQAHREGKTQMKIAGMLPGRSHDAVYSRWRDAKLGKAGTAALLAYAAECRKV